MHPRGRAGRRRRVVALAATALAGAALAPAAAHAQFPIYGKDKWLGSINEFTRPLFTQYFNQVTPENARQVGQRGAGRRAPRRCAGAQLDRPTTSPRPTTSRSTSTSCCGATSSRRGWRRCRPRSSSPRSRSGSRPSPPATRTSSGCRSSTSRPGIRRTARLPKNAGANFASSGNYVQALGGANGTDGTGYDWILNAFRLAKQYFPNTKLMLNDVAITGHDRGDGRVPEDHQHPQAREPDRRDRAPGARVRVHPQQPERPVHPGPPVRARRGHGGAQGQPRPPRRDRRPDPGHRARPRRLRGQRRPGRRDAAAPTTGDVVPTFWEHPAVEGITLWGWRQPNHWRNAQNAPIVLSNDTPKPAGAVALQLRPRRSRR